MNRYLVEEALMEASFGEVFKIVKDALLPKEDVETCKAIALAAWNLIRHNPETIWALKKSIDETITPRIQKLKALSTSEDPEEKKAGNKLLLQLLKSAFEASLMTALTILPTPPGAVIALHRILFALTNGKISLLPDELRDVCAAYMGNRLIARQNFREFTGL